MKTRTGISNFNGTIFSNLLIFLTEESFSFLKGACLMIKSLSMAYLALPEAGIPAGRD